MFDQLVEDAFGQHPVKSCRPVLARGPEKPAEVAGRNAIGMGEAMQPA